MTDIILLLLIGFAIGWIMRSFYEPEQKGPTKYEVHIDHATTLHLHYLGRLTDKQFKLLCWWIIDGKPFRLLPLMGPGIMSRGQFEQVRGELIDRQDGLSHAYKNY